MTHLREVAAVYGEELGRSRWAAAIAGWNGAQSAEEESRGSQENQNGDKIENEFRHCLVEFEYGPSP
jgi:hypothetical protein